VSKPISLDGIPKGGNHMILTQDVVKGSGSIFTGKNLIAHVEDFRLED
jgi:hypothetical protein